MQRNLRVKILNRKEVRPCIFDRGSLDLDGDPIFYHPELNVILAWSDFQVLLPEKHGWIYVGKL